MANKTVKLTSSRTFQDIGTIGQTTAQLAGNMQSVNEILDVGLRNTGNFSDSFLRVSDLVGLGFVTLNGNVLTAASFAAATGTVNVTDSVTGDGSSGTPLQLANDAATPGNSFYYGTDSSGTKGWYVLPSGGSSPLTTKGDLYGYSSTDARIPIGTDTYVLTADSTQSLGLKWAPPSGGGSSEPFNVTPDTHLAVPTGVGAGPNDEFEGATLDTAGATIVGHCSQPSSNTTNGVILPSYTPAAGSTLAIWIFCATSEIGHITVTDGGVGNTYVYAGHADTGGGFSVLAFYAANVAGTATVVTLVGTSNDVSSGAMVEIAGLTASPFIVAQGNYQDYTTAAVGADHFTTGSTTFSPQSEVYIALSYDLSSSTPPPVGTGVSSAATVWTSATIGSKAAGTSPQAVTFGSSSGTQYDTVLTLGMMFAIGGTFRYPGANPWTMWNPGALTTVSYVLDKGAMNLRNTSNTTSAWSGFYQSLPSGSAWRYRTKFNTYVYNGATASAGLLLYESATGKFIVAGILANPNLSIWMAYYSAWNAGMQSGYIGFSGFPLGVPVSWIAETDPLYIELELLSGSIYIRVSISGLDTTFVTVGSIPVATAFTTAPDNIGFCSLNGSSTYILLSADWFRRMA